MRKPEQERHLSCKSHVLTAEFKARLASGEIEMQPEVCEHHLTVLHAFNDGRALKKY